MPTVKFTYALKRFYPELDEMQVTGTTVAEVLESIGKTYPKLPSYIIDEHGMLRKHVNIFIGNKMITDRKHLCDTIKEDDEMYIMQALSGG